MTNDKTNLEQTVNNRTFVLQWHVTQKCDRDCSICYIPTDVRKKIKCN
jgi:MoaA/NifB/PqqE/SkfB family radical SAM enzyme